MTFIALRNIYRNRRRLLPLVVVIATTFSALLLGNSVLSYSTKALNRVYVENVSGDMTISAAGAADFSIFGSSQLLVGEYLVPPTIVEFAELKKEVDSLPEVRASAGLISSVARVRVRGTRRDRTVFGVDFRDYRELFPNLEIVEGTYPEPGERGAILQKDWPVSLVGRNALLTVARDTAFTIREVPITGVFRYPVEESMLRRVSIVDPETARSLNGYIQGSIEQSEVPEQQRELLDMDVDDMFSSEPPVEQGVEEEAGSATDPDELAQRLQDVTEAERARETIAGAWDFLLISLEDGATVRTVRSKLVESGYTEENGYLIRDWRSSVGGSAQIVWFLQLFFNLGLLFVAFGAAVITTNALVLSVLERTKEIGTLRALGASKGRIASMISIETVIVMVGAAALGLLIGSVGVHVLNNLALTPENEYIDVLFAGAPILGSVTLPGVLSHLAAAIALSLIAVVHPLRKALGINPVEAMTV